MNIKDASVLPPALEVARCKILAAHKKLFWGFIFVSYALLFAFYFFSSGKVVPPHSITPVLSILGVFAYLIAALFFFIYRLNRLSVKLGYVCPHCHKPLYKFMSWDYLVEATGRCPSCGEAVTNIAIERAHDPKEFVVAPGSFMDGLPKKRLPAFFLAYFVIIILALLGIHHIPRDYLIEHSLFFQANTPFAIIVVLVVIVGVLKKRSK